MIFLLYNVSIIIHTMYVIADKSSLHNWKIHYSILANDNRIYIAYVVVLRSYILKMIRQSESWRFAVNLGKHLL